jgi:hypothetical protein
MARSVIYDSGMTTTAIDMVLHAHLKKALTSKTEMLSLGLILTKLARLTGLPDHTTEAYRVRSINPDKIFFIC